ncbi:glycoprotein Xg isoform X2 [Vicugna pacos]|uniref:Glycoprotein Xg isoform X2 n=1 Tax=Vicugna pacos TaxID=30538 RepID=A0ABM5CTN5_VICPA
MHKLLRHPTLGGRRRPRHSRGGASKRLLLPRLRWEGHVTRASPPRTHGSATCNGQGDFDLADALDDPEPTKKPSSGIYPKPKPPYPPRPASPDHHGGGIYPPPKPPPRPQPGTYDSSGGFLSDKDLDDGRYPPRPRQPAGGGGGWRLLPTSRRLRRHTRRREIQTPLPWE